jgi:hypothetical protein
MPTILIDQDIYDYLASKAAATGEQPSSVLRRELHVPQPQATLEIDDQTYAFLLSKTTSLGESASSILRRELHLGGDSPDAQPTVITFHIPANTGTMAWNTRQTAVVGAVGDTLRIVNDDAVPHRLHTSGTPFAHPATDILSGQSADYVLQAPFDPDQAGPLYDHDAGTQAEFWIRVQPRP